MKEKRREEGGGGGRRYAFVFCVDRVDASGIIYDVQRQYVSQITIGLLLSAIKNTSSTFIRQINLNPMECGPHCPLPVHSIGRSVVIRPFILGRTQPETNGRVVSTTWAEINFIIRLIAR